MRNIILLITLFSIISCGRNIVLENKVISNSQDANIEQLANNLSNRYFLENRVNDCDLAIEFMKAVIVPDTINTGFGFAEDSEKHTHLGFIRISIIGESNLNKVASMEKLFIDLSCLKKMKVLDLFKILCIDNDLKTVYKEFTSIESINQRYIFEIGINGMFNGFNCIVLNNEILNMNWHKIETTPQN